MTSLPAAIATRAATCADLPGILALNARVFGPGRFTRTAYRIREGTADLSPYCRVAASEDGIVASIRFTAITVGGRSRALLLGPLAVAPEIANRGWGRRLVDESADVAAASGEEIMILVGDLPYYGRLGFVPIPLGQMSLPGPVDARRLLARELKPGALAGFCGGLAAASS